MSLRPLFGAGTLFVTLGLAAAAFAQGQPEARAGVSTDVSSTVNVDRLPIDLQRIERQLRQAPVERVEHDAFRLRYYVDVYGKSPRIELFTPDDNLTTGPAPWGAPTRREMRELVTPKEFRSPPMDLSALMRWLSDKLSR